MASKTANTNISAIAAMAIGKAMSKGDMDAARAAILPGEHLVDMTVSIKGKLTIGEDYESTPTTSIPLKETMALLLKRMGFQRDTAIVILKEVFKEALIIKGKGKGALTDNADIELANAVNETMAIVEDDFLATLPKVTKSGVVKAYLTVDTVG